MSRAPSPPLPDLDDQALIRRLEPLKARVLPGAASVPPPVSIAAPPPPAGPALPRPFTERRPRKGIEFLLPEPIVTEIKTRVAQRGVSATILLLEMLRDAGYPVLDDDFLDLRKTPRR
jgi:hypothetical protein